MNDTLPIERVTFEPPAAHDDDVPRAAGDAISHRLHQVVGDQKFADISRTTGCNSETVRRYMRGGTLSIQFVVAIAIHYRVSLNWLLCGLGGPNLDEAATSGVSQDHSHALAPCPATPARTADTLGYDGEQLIPPFTNKAARNGRVAARPRSQHTRNGHAAPTQPTPHDVVIRTDIEASLPRPHRREPAPRGHGSQQMGHTDS